MVKTRINRRNLPLSPSRDQLCRHPGDLPENERHCVRAANCMGIYIYHSLSQVVEQEGDKRQRGKLQPQTLTVRSLQTHHPQIYHPIQAITMPPTQTTTMT